MSIERVGIVGAGTMGKGISLVCLTHGYAVLLSDVIRENIAKAKQYITEQIDVLVSKQRLDQTLADTIRRNIHVSQELEIHQSADLIIESIIEDAEAKRVLFRSLESIVSENTIIATNTSSISINSLAKDLAHPERFLGIHFFNPAHIMKLVELIPSFQTDVSILERARTFTQSLGKYPVVVRDVPGFLVNRIVRNYYNEALRIVTEGVATIQQVDSLLEGAGFRMGPFRLMDLIGIDTNLDVTKSIFEQYFYEPRYQPSRLQQDFVNAGYFGNKSGKGFYQTKP